MAATASNRGRAETPVNLFTTREGDDLVQKINVEHKPSRDQILDHYDAESVEQLADQFIESGREIVDVRIGVLRGTGDETTFYAETTLLEQAEGVSEELASALIEWFDDIPGLCEHLRSNPAGALGTVLHDARVEDREWTEELAALIEELEEDGTNLEQRLKNASVWVEPENVTGGL